MDDEVIIRKRYLTQTVSTAANALPPFKKLVKRYMQFCEALETGGGVEDAERLYPELLADLYAIRAHMRKLAAQSCAFQAEQQLYAEKQAQLQASIQQAEQDIEDRKRELAEARVELAHKQEYEAVRKLVMQVPSRATTLAEQQATQREIADLQQQSAARDALLDQRKQQFGGVLDSLAALQRCIEREEPEEGAAVLGGEQGGAAPAAAAAVLQQQQPMQVG
ncbi:THO complex subunit 7B [Chlorella vulgaris]